MSTVQIVCSGSVVVQWSPFMIFKSAVWFRIMSGSQYTLRHTLRLRSLHSAYPSLHPSGAVHWALEQLNIKTVTGAFKLIDGCSLVLCSATVSVVSTGICHRNKVNSTAWLYRDGPSHKIVSFTIHYITYYLAAPSSIKNAFKHIEYRVFIKRSLLYTVVWSWSCGVDWKAVKMYTAECGSGLSRPVDGYFSGFDRGPI